MSNSIPFHKLQEGLFICLANTQLLIDSANVLFQNRKYLHSAVFSIFAFEELVKMELLLDSQNKKTDLAHDDWREVTATSKAHLEKLKRFLTQEDTLLDGLNATKSEIDEILARYYYRMKTNVLYVNWHEQGGWRWLPLDYPELKAQYESNNLLAIAQKRTEELKKEVELLLTRQESRASGISRGPRGARAQVWSRYFPSKRKRKIDSKKRASTS